LLVLRTEAVQRSVLISIPRRKILPVVVS